MRAYGSGAKPKCGYIAITFCATARCSSLPKVSGDALGDKPKRSLWIGAQVLGANRRWSR